MECINALSGIMKPVIGLRKSRRETFCALICAVLQSRTVNLSHLATTMPNRALASSNYRRFQRFFEQATLDLESVTRFIVQLCALQRGAFNLLIDRTDWDLGATRINILMLAAVHDGIAIPLAWRLLDKGACSAATAIALIEDFQALFPHTPVARLAADREFMSQTFLNWAKAKEIHCVVRLRANTHIGATPSRTRHAKAVFANLKAGEQATLQGEHYVFRRKSGPQARTQVAAARHRDGTLIVLASTGDAKEGLDLYRKRWQIETLFAALKSRGFNLMDTHLKAKERLAKLLAVLAIAFVWALRTGLWRARKQPIKRKKHQRRARSFFRYGLDFLRTALALAGAKARDFIPWSVIKLKPT